ncbi:hypothetical protein G7009_00965 [Pseudomonas capeferrum]|uniref:hypothetical protein n=1 Tax=Pseudomonas capeferrum TaxID=1495066 RepID=UPI0015E4534A|nr:hypothetical protein [Pseudomonas capeferrum]MBA1200375.1 hypothetical protein [Pseudomonas capeferrum]
MQLNGARQAWHDCHHVPSDRQGVFLEQMGLLGTKIQITEKQRGAGRAAHQALAGRVQSAIDKLRAPLRAFGDFMYCPRLDADTQELAEEVIFILVQRRSPRMTAAKRERLEYVVKGAMARYRYMHQGGQSANADPLTSPEGFRAWLDAHYGVQLESTNWERNWGGVIRLIFECCEDVDNLALAPIADAIKEMRKIA